MSANTPLSQLAAKYSFAPLTSEEGARVEQTVVVTERFLKNFERAPTLHSQPTLLGKSAAPTVRDLQEMASLQDLFPPRAFRSHRPVIGPVIILCKRLLVGFAYKMLKFSLGRQVELNQHNWNLALSVHLLDQRVEQLERLLLKRDPQ